MRVLHRVHLNVSKTPIITAILLFVCVTSERDREYYSERHG